MPSAYDISQTTGPKPAACILSFDTQNSYTRHVHDSDKFHKIK